MVILDLRIVSTWQSLNYQRNDRFMWRGIYHFDICIAIVTVAEFYVNMVLVLYTYECVQ